jgi:hypothetical protein
MKQARARMRKGKAVPYLDMDHACLALYRLSAQHTFAPCVRPYTLCLEILMNDTEASHKLILHHMCWKD